MSFSSPSGYSESAARHLIYIWYNSMKGEKNVMQDAQQKSGIQVVQPLTYHDDRGVLDEAALPKPVRRGKRRLITISIFLVLVIAAGVVFYMFHSSSATTTYQTMPVT